MYSKSDLHRLIDGATESWLPGEGQVFAVTMTPEQRKSLLAILAGPTQDDPIRVDAHGNAVV